MFHIISGQAFFTGITLLVISVAASTESKQKHSRLRIIVFLIGSIAIVASSTPIPIWFYVVVTVVTFAWIALRFRKSTWCYRARHTTVAVWLVAAFIEIPYHITPSLKQVENKCITIIGDSVTAGVGGDEKSERWPMILAREHQLQVQDISEMGETVASALKRAKKHSITSSVVVIEIGGNDILDSTTASQFASDLELLLAYLAIDERQIEMFELPLPPFYHEYGRVQRAVAAKYNVKLIPKRVFLSVIAAMVQLLIQFIYRNPAIRTWPPAYGDWSDPHLKPTAMNKEFVAI